MKSNVIPKEWVRSELQGFCNVLSGNAFKSKDFVSDGVPVVKISNVQYGEYVEKNQEYLPSQYLDDYSNYIVSGDDLLIALTRPITNEKLKICRYPKSRNQGLLNQRVAKLTADKCLPESFILYQFRTEEFMKQVKAGLSETLQPNLSPKSLAGFHCVLPPLAEQKVIADKLDTLLAQVETSKARLDRIPQILKTFRQSVLAAAVSGKLTEEWRGDSSYMQFDLELEKEQIAIEVPAVWSKGTLSKSCTVISGTAFKSKDFLNESGIPAIKISNVQYGQFEVKNQQFLPKEYLDSFANFQVRDGDLLMALTRPITNDTLKVCRYPKTQPTGLLNQRVAKFIFRNENEKIFFEYLFQSNYFKAQVTDKLSETLQPNLSPVALKKFVVAIPSEKEQTEIVRRVEELFAFAERIEQKTNVALERVNNLTQAILAKAFRGELTADWRAANPNLITGENSAEALLAKIKAEREAFLSKKKPKKKAVKKAK